MSGLFGVLDVANRGLTVTQQGIRVTGHNIANVNTPGYSRQRQVLAATAPIQNASGHLGTGVEQRTIQRITDSFIQDQLVREDSSGGAARTQADVMMIREALLDSNSSPSTRIRRLSSFRLARYTARYVATI